MIEKDFVKTMDFLEDHIRKRGLYGAILPNKDQRRKNYIYFQYHPTKLELETKNFDKMGDEYFPKHRTFIRYRQRK